jgi:hypothetical protein
MSISDFYVDNDEDGNETLLDIRPAKTSEKLTRMTIEIEGGLEFGSPRSKIPDDKAHRIVWNHLAQEIAAMHAAGLSVDIPFD